MANAHGPCGGEICVFPPSVDGSKVDLYIHETVIDGQALVCLRVDNTERLSLAQISNTLLRHYEYKIIYNRCVALGIKGVKCMPGELEVLRWAGAIPESSRRYGTITVREAERLVKSLLSDSHPANLPAHFVFSVIHSCGWGCAGDFSPVLYRYTCAKCITCGHCNGLFSPNKFIFHFHHSPGSTYCHPDAATINSWRRHLRLAAEHPSERLVHMWEEVKATFIRSLRKPRVLAASASSIQQRPTAVTPYQPSPDAIRVPFPAPRVMAPHAFALGEPSEPWMDHGRVATNPFDRLYTGYSYSPFMQPSDFRLPQFAVHNNTALERGFDQLGVAVNPSLRSAFEVVSAQHDDTAAGDLSRRPTLSKLM